MELNVVMMRRGVTANDLADVIKLSRPSFTKRRNGQLPFKQHEIKLLTQALGLTQEQVNVIFFDGYLHDGNSASPAP
jgi:response regulator RpfG family c-di-GMP phosphodiesterase